MIVRSNTVVASTPYRFVVVLGRAVVHDIVVLDIVQVQIVLRCCTDVYYKCKLHSDVVQMYTTRCTRPHEIKSQCTT
jgi:hypothetical protein